METIGAVDAIERMRRYSAINSPFRFKHLTYNQQTNETNGLRVVDRALLRQAMKDDVFITEADHYLLYVDMDMDESRMCFKKLIRQVAFAPDYEWQKVDWFIND